MNDFCSDSIYSKRLAKCLTITCKHHVDAAYYEDNSNDEDVSFTSFAYGCGKYTAFKPFAEGEWADYPDSAKDSLITLFELH